MEKKPGTPTFDDLQKKGASPLGAAHLMNELEESPLTLQNAAVFTPEEIERYRKEAEHNVAVRLRAEAAKALVEKLEREALSKGDPNEEIVAVLIDVPGFADRITIDGVMYMHNTIANVPEKKAGALRDIMDKAWRHERSYREPNRETYVRPKYRAFDNGAITPAR